VKLTTQTTEGNHQQVLLAMTAMFSFLSMMAILPFMDEGRGSLAPLLRIYIWLTIEHFLGFWRGSSTFVFIVGFHAVFISMALRGKSLYL